MEASGASGFDHGTVTRVLWQKGRWPSRRGRRPIPGLRGWKFDVPTSVLHGEDDQVVPVKDAAKKSAKLIRGATEIYYPGGAHGITATQPDRVNADLLEFLKKGRKTFKAA